MQDENPSRNRPLDELANEFYDSLRALAAAALRGSSGRLDPTELVHQAWLRLSRRYEDMSRVEFMALSATIMRRIAVDEARRRALEPHSAARITLSGLARETTGGEVDLLLLDEALERLRQTDERWARIVELRFFGSLSGDEVAEALGLSRRTVIREWALARAWLKRELE